MLKRKREFFPTSFEVILSAVALPFVLNAKFNLELILFITIFVFLSLVFAAVEGRKNFPPERFEDSIHLGLPF